MTKDFDQGRRGFLRGLGAAVALPSFESLRPLLAASTPAKTIATTAAGNPLRMAYLYIPNGVNLSHWRPIGEGRDYQLGETMAPLSGLKDDFQIFTGFEQANARSGGDGPGDHARSNATFLTCARAKKTAGYDIKVGVSIDQIAARAAQQLTRLPSLELSCDGVRNAGACDSGYSCAYQYNLSWRSERQPMTPEANPRHVFERLFGTGDPKVMQARLKSHQSVLDFVSEDAQRMQKILGNEDSQKLDEYLTSVREIERRIERAEHFEIPPMPDIEVPREIPTSYTQHLKLMMDMMVLAFQTDSTRVISFMLARDGSNRRLHEIGVSEGHHHISHHKKKKENLEKIAKIDHFYVSQFAYFMQKMKETKDVDGSSLLENSMIVYGSGIADGNRHNHDDLPIILGGHGGGILNPGRHVNLNSNVPLANLYLRMLSEFGVSAERFGDSSEMLRSI